MPAVFNIAALQAALGQSQGTGAVARPAAHHVPPGQSRFAPSTTPNGAAPFGAGAPVATGAALPPSAHLPIPAPPPVVSTSQAGALAAAAINGLNRGAMGRDRPDGPEPRQQLRPAMGARGEASGPEGLPGGPAPAARGGTPAEARAAYGLTKIAAG